MIAGEALWWVPSAAALAMTVLALFVAIAQPQIGRASCRERVCHNV